MPFSLWISPWGSSLPRSITRDGHWRPRVSSHCCTSTNNGPDRGVSLERCVSQLVDPHCASRSPLWCICTGCTGNSSTAGRITQKTKVAVPMETHWDLIKGVRKPPWWRCAHIFETGKCSSGHIFMLFCSLFDTSLRLLSFLYHSLRVAQIESVLCIFFFFQALCPNIWEYFNACSTAQA